MPGRVVSSIAGLALACAVPVTPASAQIATGGIVAGVVLNERGAPAPLAVVTLSTQESKPKDAVALTDSRGAFGFAAVPPGNYYLWASVEGCATVSYGARSPDQPPAVLSLRPGEKRDAIQLRCTPLASIAGTVLDSDGDPLAGAQVQLLRAVYERWKPKFRHVANSAAGSRGEYRFLNVLPGRYVVLAKAWPGMGNAIQPEGVDARTPAAVSFGTQFYRNADRLPAATTLTVAGRAEIAGIDFALPFERNLTVAGKVNAPPDFDPKLPVQVSAYSLGLSNVPDHITMAGTAPQDFRFTLPNLAPGSYLVTAAAGRGDHHWRAATKLELGDDVSGLALTLDPGVEIAGRVTLEGGAGAAFRPSKVTLVPGDALAAVTGWPSAEVKPDGTFRLNNVPPGIWDISPEPVPPGGYIKSMRLGNQDVLLEDMVIGPETRGPLNIVISARGGVVTGTAVKGEEAVRGVVLLAPEGRLRPVWTFYLTTSTDEDGRFEFRGVTPGRYRLFAFENMSAEAAQDPEFLAPFRDRGEEFEVPEDGRVSRKVQLTPVPPDGSGR